MFVTCKNILNLPGLEKMQVVAGREGLNKVIRWVHVAEIPDVSNWVKGGELLFITGVAIKDDTEALLKFVKDINMRKLSGLVINIGPYIKKTPKEVIDFADSVDFPVFELPFEVKLIDVTQNICRTIFTEKLQKESMNNFMREIIFEDINITEEILNRATLYGYNENKNYCAIVVDIDAFSSYLKKNKLYDEDVILNIKNRIQEVIEYVMYKNNKKCLYAMQSDAFFFMVPIEKNNNNIEYIAECVKKQINTRMDFITVSIGIGGICGDLKSFNKVILEARKALEMAKLYGKNNCIINYSNLGIFRLFFEINNYDEMKKLFDENLLKLKEYDEKNSSNLLETLIVYLKENRNLGKTAEILYIHRNTIKYRVKRIEEILNCDLKDEEVIFNIKLCIRIGLFLKLIK
ncbi:PucR family transcriptional regulator [Clostridium sp. WILCCON 0269]|uniref:PucR family transcriptional regulator n=1 Tax=Candidatus Clostridium eludens TaxID=3381663 RepID=A0ABW8SKH4_9CLOT